MRKLTLFFTVLLFCIVSSVSAETITGRVLDAKSNEAVIGATVKVKGTTNGTITNYDGNFTLDCEKGAILSISFISYKTKEVPAKTGMVVKLSENTAILETVMVVAYGVTNKSSFTGSATVIQGETLEKKNPSELSKSLAGEVAGVQVVSTSGQPGTNATIRIGGIHSVNSSSAPLYVVDGIPYDGDVSAIDPSNVASTTILKDATATSLYGARGSNGVILITTKKGTAGEAGKIDVDLKYGVNMHLLPMHDVITSAQEYVEMSWQGFYNSAWLGASGKTDREAFAANTASGKLFTNKTILPAYNRWDVEGADLINPSTGKFYEGVQAPTIKAGYQNAQSWEDALFSNGEKVEANIKIHGGSDKTTYFTSFGYLKDEGYVVNTDFSRFTARANVDHQAKKWLKGSMNMAYSYSELNDPGQNSDASNNALLFVNTVPSIYPVYRHDDNGDVMMDPKQPGQKLYDYGMYEGYGRTFNSGINPAGSIRLDQSNSMSHQFTGSSRLDMTLSKDVNFAVNVGLQDYNTIQGTLTNMYYGDAEDVGRVVKFSSNLMNLLFNQILTYKHKFADDHSVDAFVAHELQYTDQSWMQANKNYTARPDGIELSNAIQVSGAYGARSKSALESYFGQIRYNYKEKYFLNANMRRDGSSKFADGNRWGNFGSLGVSWLASSEDFMQDVEWVRTLKLKTSYGLLGNQEVGDFRYTNLYAVKNIEDQVGLVWSFQGNPDLTWETTAKLNVGLEADILNSTWDNFGGISLEVNLSKANTTDMMFARSVAPSLGYSYYYVNEGEMEVLGYEFQVSIAAVQMNNFKMDIRFNGSRYQDEILEMPLEADGLTHQVMSGAMSKGHSQFDYYMRHYEGVDPATGKALYRQYYDNNNLDASGDPTVITDLTNYMADKDKNGEVVDLAYTTTDNPTGATAYYADKSALYDLQGGFGLNIETYGFDISASFQYGLGGYGYDYVYASLMNSDQPGSYNWHKDMRNAWTPTNTDTDIPMLSDGTYTYANYASDRFLTSNSYLSLSNIRVGYTFPKKWVEKAKLNSLNLWVSGDNLLCLSAREGYLPFTSFTGTTSTTSYSPLSTVMAGVKFTF